MSDLKNIETFAVIDLETNNLPDYNFNRANITELSIQTISKNDLATGNINENPRIVNKLTMVFNPQMLINPEATKKTGLDNYMLEAENKFDKNAANTVIGFIKHLRQPVCLVAHNGDNFDFPVLKRTFDKLEMSLPENLLCLDTYTALKAIDNYILNGDIQKTNNETNINENSNSSLIILDVEKDEEFQETLKTEYTNIKEEKNCIQRINETTPKRPPEPIEQLVKRQRNNILSNHDDKSNGISRNRAEIRSRRVLFSPSPNSSITTNLDKSSFWRPNKKLGYYRLENIYKRLFNSDPIITHQAEADVILLQKIMMYYGKDIVEYSEHNAVFFSEIKRLGTPQAKKRN